MTGLPFTITVAPTLAPFEEIDPKDARVRTLSSRRASNQVSQSRVWKSSSAHSWVTSLTQP